MDRFCEQVGTDDANAVESEHSDCNDRRYARFEGGEWRCWSDLLEDTRLACVDEAGELTTCLAPDTAGGKCTRNESLTAMINDRDAACQGSPLLFNSQGIP